MIMNIKQKKINIEPRIKLNYNIYMTEGADVSKDSFLYIQKVFHSIISPIN